MPLLINFSLKAQEQIHSKDNPAAFDAPKETLKMDEKIKNYLGNDISSLVLNANKIEAYHLNEWEKDKTAAGFHHFKVIEKVANLSAAQRKSLLDIILKEKNYVFSDIIKRCEFGPNLGFKFINGDKSSSLLIALNCDMLRYLYAEKTLKADCDPAYNGFVKLGKNIFPNSFNIKLTEPIVAENVPTSPTEEATQNVVNPVDDNANLVTENEAENNAEIENESTDCEEKEEAEKEDCTVLHTVKAGETLSKIARKYNVNVKNLKAWNKEIKRPKDLQPNMQLKIENQ